MAQATHEFVLVHAAAPPPGDRAGVRVAKAALYAARLGVTPIDHDPMLSEPDVLVRILERI